jgi:hypothetical protein
VASEATTQREATALDETNRPAEQSGSCEGVSDAEIDESLTESFPASDPPQWTLGVDPHCEPQDKGGEAEHREEAKHKDKG